MDRRTTTSRVRVRFALLVPGLLVMAACSTHSPRPAAAPNTLNRIMSDAVEPNGAPTFGGNLFGVLEYQATRDTPLEAGRWRGQPDQFNRFSPRYADGEVLRVPQAGINAHGRLFGGVLDYRVALLTGDNTVLRNEDSYFQDQYVRLTDASVTVHAVPHARLRLGLFRQPLGDEAASPQQRYIWLSHVTQQMVQERYFRSDGSVNGSPNLDRGPVSAFRDIGVQLFDSFATGDWEHTYALMLGLGTGVDPTLNHTGIDRYLYWSSEWLFGDSGRQRDGAKLFAWGQFGERTLNAGPTQTPQEFDRSRSGVGLTLRKAGWSLAREWIKAKGMIYHGPDGGTIPGRISDDGTLVAGYNVLPESDADGWYLDVGYRVRPALDLRARYDVLDRGNEDPATAIRFQGLSLGAASQLSPAIQVTIGYQFRRYRAPRLAGDSPTNVLLDGVDNRFGVRFLYTLGL